MKIENLTRPTHVSRIHTTTMTCFWDGLINALGEPLLKQVLKCTIKKKITSPKKFVKALKQKNEPTKDVEWNGPPMTEEFREKFLEENRKFIKEFDVDSIDDGYYCRADDPFLFLVSQLFGVTIEHDLVGNRMTYTNTRTPDGKVLRLVSNRGHLWVR